MTKTIPSHETKTCTKCGEEKPLTGFGTEKRNHKIKILARCRQCTLAYQTSWRNTQDRVAMNEKYRGWRRDWLADKSAFELASYRKACASYAAMERAKVKIKVFEMYGGSFCACCGETELCFLSIDHINNDGFAARKRGEHPSGGTAFYRWLMRSKYPPGFQVLCMNCQFGKKNNRGICPHQSCGVTTIPQGSTAKRLEAHRTPLKVMGS